MLPWLSYEVCRAYYLWALNCGRSCNCYILLCSFHNIGIHPCVFMYFGKRWREVLGRGCVCQETTTSVETLVACFAYISGSPVAGQQCGSWGIHFMFLSQHSVVLLCWLHLISCVPCAINVPTVAVPVRVPAEVAATFICNPSWHCFNVRVTCRKGVLVEPPTCRQNLIHPSFLYFYRSLLCIQIFIIPLSSWSMELQLCRTLLCIPASVISFLR